MTLIDEIAKLLSEKTKNNPIFLHMDAIGFLNLGEHIGNSVEEVLNNKLDLFNKALNKSEKMGANIFIPAFSYSIADGSVFDVRKSESQVGAATEYFRKKNINRRTMDPMFSYTAFTTNDKLKSKRIGDYNTFGEDGLISQVFDMDGYIASIGHVLWHPTEAHFLEKKLGIEYRKDKLFSGEVVDLDGNSHNVTSTFFCRDLDLNMIADFKPFEKDMHAAGIVEKWCVGDFYIEVAKMQDIFKLMKKKINDKYYFCRPENQEYKINI